MEKINATAARNDFFNILEKGYLDKRKYLIYKSGIPIMILSPYTKTIKRVAKNRTYSNLIERVRKNKLNMKEGSNSVKILRDLRRHNG